MKNLKSILFSLLTGLSAANSLQGYFYCGTRLVAPASKKDETQTEKKYIYSMRDDHRNFKETLKKSLHAKKTSGLFESSFGPIPIDYKKYECECEKQPKTLSELAKEKKLLVLIEDSKSSNYQIGATSHLWLTAGLCKQAETSLINIECRTAQTTWLHRLEEYISHDKEQSHLTWEVFSATTELASNYLELVNLYTKFKNLIDNKWDDGEIANRLYKETINKIQDDPIFKKAKKIIDEAKKKKWKSETKKLDFIAIKLLTEQLHKHDVWKIKNLEKEIKRIQFSRYPEKNDDVKKVEAIIKEINKSYFAVVKSGGDLLEIHAVHEIINSKKSVLLMAGGAHNEAIEKILSDLSYDTQESIGEKENNKKIFFTDHITLPITPTQINKLFK